jgi:hypothetical protein
MLPKLFHKIERKGVLPNSKSQYHPDTKTGKGHNKKRKLCTNFLDEHRCKNSQ